MVWNHHENGIVYIHSLSHHGLIENGNLQDDFFHRLGSQNFPMIIEDDGRVSRYPYLAFHLQECLNL